MMILTITMNPSIDMSYPIETLTIDGVTRVQNVSKTAGGKGLNVSRVLHQMGADLVASGLLGGHFGAFIKSELDKQGIKHQFGEIDGETRNSIALLHDGGKQTEVLESGPEISEREARDFLATYEELLDSCSLVTMSGSLPRGLDVSFYSQLTEMAHARGVRVLLDTSGAALQASVQGDVKPDLIKPNETEVSALIDQKLNLSNISVLKNQLSSGDLADIKWIVISLGADGALAKYDNTFYRVRIPSLDVVNPVGSGDSTIAGFALAMDQGNSPVDILKTGMVTGMLNALEETTGSVNPERFDEFFKQVEVEEI